MIITDIAEVLANRGLSAPSLKALDGLNTSYKCLIYQPLGSFVAGDAGVYSAEPEIAGPKLSAFLALAQKTGAHLAVVPECSMPWNIMLAALEAGITPVNDAIWVLGCESLRYSQIKTLQLKNSEIIFEDLPTDHPGWVDPVVYVFNSKTIKEGASKLVVVVQFKTHPMADEYEQKGLQLGQQVFRFQNQPIGLATIVCSDALAITDDDASKLFKNSLVIHIQLNQKPRQIDYRQYRYLLFNRADSWTQIICLNWANGTGERKDDKVETWTFHPLSAWYVKKDARFDESDKAIATNHWGGVYFTWNKELHAHSLYLHPDEAVFLFDVTKVFHSNTKAVESRRRGPQLLVHHTWDGKVWSQSKTVDSGFNDLVAGANAAKADVMSCYKVCPVAAERLITLSAGILNPTEGWEVQRLRSFVTSAEEKIERITYCKDIENSQLRTTAINRCDELMHVLAAGTLPPALSKLRDKPFKLAWNSTSPYTNVTSDELGRLTLVYVGDSMSNEQIDRMLNELSVGVTRHIASSNQADTATQSIVVWHLKSGAYIPEVLKISHRIDREPPSGASWLRASE